jgi:hypothetical protein
MEFGQKTYGSPAMQSAGPAPGAAPAGGLDMGGDSSKVKMGILGGIVAIFGIGAAVALSGGDEKVAAQHQAQAQREQMMTPTEMAAPAAAPGSELAVAPGADPSVAPGADPNAVAMAQAPAIEPEATPSAAPAVSTPEAMAAAPVATPTAPEPVAAPALATAPAPAVVAEAPATARKAESTPVESSEQRVSANEGDTAAGPSQAAPVARKPLPQAADALDAWWQKSNANANANGFGVQFVGQAANQPSLVIRFSQLADPNVAAQHIKLKAVDGTEVATNWQKGANDYVLVNANLAPGRYTVSIDPGLSSSTGSTLGMPLNGPIYIQ